LFPINVLRMRKTAIGPQVNIFNTTANCKDINGPQAFYNLLNTGVGQRSLTAGGTASWTWLLSGLNSDYQVRLTVVSGTTPGGSSSGSWLSLGTSRSWTLTTPGDFNSVTVEIRRVSDSVVIATATVTMSYIDTGGGGGGGGP
jgi:hypothetical protein